MQTLEFEADITDGILSIPVNLLPELITYQHAKVILFLEEKPKKKLYAHKVKIDNFVMPKRDDLYDC